MDNNKIFTVVEIKLMVIVTTKWCFKSHSVLISDIGFFDIFCFLTP